MIGLLTHYAWTQFLSPFPNPRKARQKYRKLTNGEKAAGSWGNDKNTSDEDECFKIFIFGQLLSYTRGSVTQFARVGSGNRYGQFYHLICQLLIDESRRKLHNILLIFYYFKI
jgi:hypothetical protein